MKYMLIISMAFLMNLSITYATGISGIIKDKTTNEPVPGVTVLIVNSPYTTHSNDSGKFFFEDLPSGLYKIDLQCLGYTPFDTSFTYQADSSQTIQLALQPVILGSSEEINVTAQRYQTWKQKVPKSVRILSQKQVQEKSSRSTPEAMMEMTGVWVQKTNHGGGSPIIRGLTGNQTLTLVDGIRLNNTTFRYGPNQYLNTIDANSIDKIEVIQGSESVLYGSDAMGGIIQVLTKNPEFTQQGTNFSGKGALKMMSGGMEQSGRAELEVNTTYYSALFGFTKSTYGDLIAGEGLSKEAPNAYSEYAGDVKLRARITNRHLLTFNYQHMHQDDVPRYDKINLDSYALYHFDPQVRQLAYLRMQSYFASKYLNQIQTTLALHRSLEDRTKQKTGKNVIQHESDDVRTYALSIETHSIPNEQWRFISGLEFYYDYVLSTAKDFNQESNLTTVKRGLYPDNARSTNFSLFTSHSINWDKFDLNLGARANYFTLSAKDNNFGDIYINPNAFVGNVSTSYAIYSNLNLYTSIRSGFRAPNINDISSFGTFAYGMEVPSKNLASEKSVTYEIGSKFYKPNITASFSLYHMDLYDLIIRTPAAYKDSSYYMGERVYKKENAERAYIRGYEAEIEYKFHPYFAGYGGLSYTYGQNISAGEPLSRIPPLNGKLGVRYQAEKKSWVEAVWLFALKQDRLSSGDRDDKRIPENGTPGWQVVNLNIGYSLSWSVIYLGMQNIFNEAYRLHGSGVDGYGRSYWFRIQFNL
jgi:hemoglobin/transferrin/lactoferrin receptor protein